MHYRYILAFSEKETTIENALKIYDIHGYGVNGADFVDLTKEVETAWADIQLGKTKTTQIFQTIDEYAQSEEYIRHEDGRYGRLFNWDGLYDYYKIGGRFDGLINGKNIVNHDEFIKWISSPAFTGIDGFILGSTNEEEIYDTQLNSDNDIDDCRQEVLEMVDNLYDDPEYWKFAIIDMHR